MNKMMIMAALGCLTLGSLVIGGTAKVNAFAAQTLLPVETSPTLPQAVDKVEAQSKSTQAVAYTQICEVRYTTYGDPVTCCADSDGAWACVW